MKLLLEEMDALFALLLVLVVVQVHAQNEEKRQHAKRSSKQSKTIPCEPDWYYFDEKCYKVVKDEKGLAIELNWDDAAAKCEEYGARLASIQTSTFQKFFVMNFVMGTKRDVWLGLHKPAGKSAFEWHDGSPVIYTNWGWNQPSKRYNGKDEDCVHIMYNKDNINGKWNDIHCIDYRMPFVCQKDQNPKLSSPDAKYCPDAIGGGRRFRDSCFTFVRDEKSWDDAEDHCVKHYNGHLATISDNGIKYYIDDLLNGRNSGDYWIGIHFQNGTFQKWSSGRYVDFVLVERFRDAWARNFRRTHYDFIDTCAYILDDNSLKVDRCKMEKYFICEVTLNQKPPTLIPHEISGSECPGDFDDWIDLGVDKCFYLSKDIASSWHVANFKCMQRGGSLASIHSQAELDVLEPFYSNEEPKVHIGLIRDQNFDGFVWADGSKVDFEAWQPGEPNDKSEKCVELRTSAMVWNDIPCSAEKKYICSVKKTSLNGTQTALGIYEQTSNSIDGALSQAQKHHGSHTAKNEPNKKEFHSSGLTGLNVMGIISTVLLIVVVVGGTLYYFQPWGRSNFARSTSRSTLVDKD